jgi:hypothetical protein
MMNGGRRARVIAVAISIFTLAASLLLGEAGSAGAAFRDATPPNSNLLGHAVSPPPPKWGHPTSLAVNPDFNHPVPGHDQTARTAGPEANDVLSSNWAGLVENDATPYSAISANWTVPTVQTTPAGTSSTWIGIDGYKNQNLIQTGTEQDTWEGFPDYYAWYELLPGAEINIGVVKPGDSMSAHIFKDATPANTWTIDISDLSVTGDSFSKNFSYTTPETSAEWIEEMTSIIPNQPPLANFGTANFSDLSYTSSNPTGNVSTFISIEDSSNSIIAYPVQTDPTDLTVHYGAPPATDTMITASPSPVVSGTSVTYAATVTSGQGPPAGSVVFSAGSTTLCTAPLTNGAGNCSTNAAPVGNNITITGQYQDDGAGFAASTGTAKLTVTPPPSTTTTITASSGTVQSGTSVTYSATVTTNAVGTPTGSVSFSTGSTSLCTATVSNGSGQCSSGAAPVGSDVISGQYQGKSFASSTGTTTLVVNAPPSPPHGYWLVGSDGGIFSFGSAQFYGSTGSLRLQRPVVGIVPTTDRYGYWLDASDGGIFAFGDAGFHGSLPGLGLNPAGSGLPNSLNAPIVGMVPSAGGGGYFMVASDGGVFAFGDAHFAGSCPGIGGCAGAAVAVMPDASGNGYWLVTQSGHIYTFGDASYFGAPGPQAVPVTSAVRTPDGKGYWILFANGAIANYGDAGNFGSPAGQLGGLNPATAIFTTSDGEGYWVAAADGGVQNFGDAPNDGSMLGTNLNGSIIAATGW